MACCEEFQTNCLKVVNIGYLKDFIGANVQNSANGSSIYISRTDDDYCPTYAELTGGTIIQTWSQGSTPRTDRDGIVINSTCNGTGSAYANNQLVNQADLSLRYTRFNTLSISRSGSGNISECGGNATLTYTYNHIRNHKYMNNSCDITSSSTTVNSPCSELTYSTTYGSVTSCTSYSIGKNGSISAASRSDSISCSTAFRGATKTSNTITITQNALTGSYSVFDRNIATGVTATATTSTSFGCAGGSYGASGTGHYNIQKHWKDSCGTEYTSVTAITGSATESLGSKSGSFGALDCCQGTQTNSGSLTFTYGSYSKTVNFSQTCADCSSECGPTCTCAGFSVSPENFIANGQRSGYGGTCGYFTCEGASQKITGINITSVTSSESWLYNIAAFNDERFRAWCDYNNTESDRTTTVTVNSTINGDTCSTKTFTVKQNCYETDFWAGNKETGGQVPKNIDMPMTGGTVTLKYSSEKVPYLAVKDGGFPSDWTITINPGSGIGTITIVNPGMSGWSVPTIQFRVGRSGYSYVTHDSIRVNLT